jgi:hypothetical protein
MASSIDHVMKEISVLSVEDRLRLVNRIKTNPSSTRDLVEAHVAVCERLAKMAYQTGVPRFAPIGTANSDQ